MPFSRHSLVRARSHHVRRIVACRNAYRTHALITACRAVALWVLLFHAPPFTFCSAQQRPSPRPNIVLIIADDLGYGELGCQGNSEIPTPAIDRIAQSGTRMTAGYVSAAYCSASRAGLMTGRYQTRFGYEFNPIGDRNVDPRVGIPRNLPTFAERLRDAGYATALIGKWHLGGHASQHPLRRGFDQFFGFLHEGHYYSPPPYTGLTTMLRRKALPSGESGRWQSGNLVLSTHMGHNEPPYDANNPLLRNGQPVTESRYLTRAFADEACQFIRRNQDRPFFLCLAFNAVHSPLQAETEILQRVAHIEDIHRRIFAAMLVALDEAVRDVQQTLTQTGVRHNTLLVFLSDNGGPTRELTSSNRPLRGGKGDMYEGGIRVPFLMQWPGKVPSGKVYEAPVSSLDILPTALAAAGIRFSAGEFDGKNVLPYLTGQRSGAPHEELFWRAGNRAALRLAQWKIVRNNNRGGKPNEWELYNLATDMGEQRNVAKQHPEVLSQLLRRWDVLNSEMAEPVFGRRR